MSFLSSFYPQPVVAGTTEGTFAEGDDARIVGAAQKSANLSDLASASTARANLDLEVGVDVAAFNDARLSDARTPTGSAGGGLSGTYPNPTLAPLAPTAAQRTQTISRRFAEWINVKDYGAVGDGIADDWLAIQRAVYDSALNPEDRIALTIDPSETVTFGNRTVFKLMRVGQGLTTVFFPQGTYRITKPIVIAQGVNLMGYNRGGSRAAILNDSVTAGGQFPCVTDLGYITTSDESYTVPSNVYGFNYNHNGWICGLNFNGGTNNSGPQFGYLANQSGSVEKEYAWIKWPQSGSAYALANGSSGGTTLTTNYVFNYKQGGKIKLYPSGQILDVAYASGTTIYLKNPLSTNVVNENYAFGFEKHCGIWMAGGEGSKIQNCWANAFLGAGFFIYGGSPSPIIENTMANFCDIAYRIFNAPTVLIKPSGDCNNQIIKCEGFTNTTLISGKFEDPRPLTGPYSNPNIFVPYPNLTQCKSMFEIEGLPSGTPTYFGVEGCTQNGGNLGFVNEPFVKTWALSLDPIIKLNGVRTLGACYRAFLEAYDYNGTLRYTEGRDDVLYNDDERHHYAGAIQYYNSQKGAGQFVATHFEGTQSEAIHAVRSGGTMLDVQNRQTKHRSGRMPNLMRFTRSGTTATIEYRDATDTASSPHGLVVGDSVYFRNYTFSSGSGNLAWNNNVRDGQYFPLFFIKSVPTPETFTITVADSGATAGSANIWAQQYAALHVVSFDEHVIQMPSNVGSTYTYDWTDPASPISEFRAFSIYDRKKDIAATLAVPSGAGIGSATGKGTWWVREAFAMGGTSSVYPATRILHGAGTPSASAPNGSLYLRTDGDASTTLYVRAGGTWKPLSSYEA